MLPVDFDSSDIRTSDSSFDTPRVLIGFGLEFAQNINLDSTLVLKQIARLIDEPTVQDDTFSKFYAIGRVPTLYYRLGSTEPAEGIISYITLRSDGSSG